MALGFVDHYPPHLVGFAQPPLQLFAVLVDIDGSLRHATLHGGLRYRGSLPNQHARVEWFGDDVLAAEFEALHAVSQPHGIRHVFARQRRQCPSGRQLHLVVYRGCAHVQGAAEDEREPQHVVHLVRKIRPSRGHDGVRPCGSGQIVGNLRIGVRHGKHDGIARHSQQHLGRDTIAAGEAEEYIRSHQGIRQRARLGFHGEMLLVGIHALPCGPCK